MNVITQQEHSYSAFKTHNFWHIHSTNGSTGLYRIIYLQQPLSLHQSAPAFASNSLNRINRNLTIRQREKFLLLTIPEIEPQQWSSYWAATSVLWVLCTHSPSHSKATLCGHFQNNQIHELCTSLSASSPNSDLIFSTIFLTWIRKAKRYLSPTEMKTLFFFS